MHIHINVLCVAIQFQTYIHVVCAILLSSFSTYANVGQGNEKAQKTKSNKKC